MNSFFRRYRRQIIRKALAQPRPLFELDEIETPAELAGAWL